MQYLADKGHIPVKHLSGGRASYLCPLPWHSETKPSFMVWTNAEYENFYCFGCQNKYNIIHLVSLMEGISKSEAVNILSDGLTITVADEQKLAQEKLMKMESTNPVEELSDSLLFISRVCNLFLQSVDYDPNEHKIIDNVWKFLDKSLLDYDIEAIENMQQNIESVISRRIDKINERRQEEMKSKYAKN